MKLLVRWLNIKIHTVSDHELTSIINSFITLEFVDSEIINALERYVEVKDMQIQHATIGLIMDYFALLKIRSVPILDKCCDYFVENGRTLPVSVLRSMVISFWLPQLQSKTFIRILETSGRSD